MSNWALVTGTTSGIGKSFCNLLAAQGYNLVLVSRDLQRMKLHKKEIETRFGVEVQIIKADLSNQMELAEVESRCMAPENPIQVLVNNAGFGINSDFGLSSINKQSELLDVMVHAPLRLSHAVITNMKNLGKGYIINVSSVAAFMAGSTYCSAKSWLTVFSESISKELRPFGINVHCVCPGFTRTEFHTRCGQDVSGVPNYFWLDSDRVARQAWMSVVRGKVLSIPGLQYKFLVALHRYAPRNLVVFYGFLAKKFLRRGGRN